MKNLFLSFVPLLAAVLVFAGCESENLTDNPVANQKQINDGSNSNEVIALNKFGGELEGELALARSGTAKYHDISRAIQDGYVDINVVIQGMGYHYLNSNLVDSIFDPEKPEILVYTKNPVNGKMRLVAVEYAVPNTEPMPEGFTGSEDVWVNNTDFNLWLVHAWVWYNNPHGMFNGMNPRVHVEEGEITYP
jgi:hypothetical protein